jgi:hypothetical protein
MVQKLHHIGYRGWYVLETSSPTSDAIADTRASIEYVRPTFRIPPAPDRRLTARHRARVCRKVPAEAVVDELRGA